MVPINTMPTFVTLQTHVTTGNESNAVKNIVDSAKDQNDSKDAQKQV